MLYLKYYLNLHRAATSIGQAPKGEVVVLDRIS